VRKRGKQRATRALINPLNYVLDSITPLTRYNPNLLDLKIKNHASMLALTQGRATRDDYNRLIALANIVEALYLMGFGKTYKDVMDQGHEALLAVGRRANGSGSYVLKADEMAALNLLMELHDAQIDIITVKDMERAIKLVEKERSAGRTTPIKETKHEPA
jgi:hypothetical protein